MFLPWDCIFYIWSYIRIIPREHVLICKKFAYHYYQEVMLEKHMYASIINSSSLTCYIKTDILIYLYHKYNEYYTREHNMSAYDQAKIIDRLCMNRGVVFNPIKYYLDNDQIIFTRVRVNNPYMLDTHLNIIYNCIEGSEYNNDTDIRYTVSLFTNMIYNSQDIINIYNYGTVKVNFNHKVVTFVMSNMEDIFINLISCGNVYDLDIYARVIEYYHRCGNLLEVRKFIKLVGFRHEILKFCKLSKADYDFIIGNRLEYHIDCSRYLNMICQYIPVLPRNVLFVNRSNMQKYYDYITPDERVIDSNFGTIMYSNITKLKYTHNSVGVKDYYERNTTSKEYQLLFSKSLNECTPKQRRLVKIGNTILGINRLGLGFKNKEYVNRLVESWMIQASICCIETNGKEVGTVNKYTIARYIVQNFPYHYYSYNLTTAFSMAAYNVDLNIFITHYNSLPISTKKRVLSCIPVSINLISYLKKYIQIN